MKHSEFDSAYKSYNDALDVKNINDTRKPQIFLKDLNKLRKMRELRRYDELKRKGINVRLKAVKNKIRSPFSSKDVFLEFGKGFDEFSDTLNLALGLGIVEKGGSWYSYGTIKEQGWDSFIEKVRQTDGYFDQILMTIKDATKN